MADQQRPFIINRKAERVRVVSDSTASRERMVLRSGQCNTTRRRMHFSQQLRLLHDLFTSLVDLPWRWIALILCGIYFGSWLLFAVLWWFIALAHGDLEPEHLPPLQEESGWKPCITDIYGFTSCFLFSIDNQHASGLGSRTPTEECPQAIISMCVQAIVGVILETILMGTVFAKIIRPKQRTRTILFSENAVISKRDGALCLMIRVADMRKSHIIEASVHLLILQKRVTAEGELLAPFSRELRVERYGGRPSFFLLWPKTVVHRIDQRSPFYTMSFEDVLRAKFEIIAILEGTIESTDQKIQARYSYLPEEILWGHRFRPLLDYNRAVKNFEVDFSLLNGTVQVETPLCSALHMDASRAPRRLGAATADAGDAGDADNNAAAGDDEREEISDAANSSVL